MSDIVEELRQGALTRDDYRWVAADEIERLRAALRMLYDEMDEYQRINNLSAYSNQVMRQARAALEYENPGQNRKSSDELSLAAARIEALEAEVKVWQGHTKTAVWSDSEECKLLTRINAALLEAPTVDIDVVVPDRDYSAMTPKDCYEAGLLDGVYQAREAIKAAARAALEGK